LLENDGLNSSQVIKQTQIENIDLLPTNLFSDIEFKFAGNFDSQYFLLDKLSELNSSYDYIIMDCPPNWGAATRMALVAANGLLVPVECQKWAVKGSSQILDYVNKMHQRVNPKLNLLGFVINKYDSRRSVENAFNQALRNKYGDLVFQTEFHNHVQYTEAVNANLPLNYYLPTSKQSKTFRTFVEELTKRINYDN